jgi:UDP-N-acetylglucosamine--N-acetylmuramyl-(pentapeptide) pyrophosphoryl-undecaprenol N-acetylglucosamine transferase
MTILVFGGSQGARNINNAIDEIIESRSLKNVQIIWQTGQMEFNKYKEKYKNFDDINLCIMPFIDRMDYAYSASNFAITRAGAMTISELAAAGLPAILVPYPFAAANHQHKNARTIVEQGAALLVEDNQDLAKNLSAVIFSILESPDKITQMADKMARFHHENTMRHIEEELAKLINNDDDTKL